MAALFTGCNDVEDLLTFHFSDRTQIRIQSASPLNLPVEIATPAITSSSHQQFENNNTKAELVRDVKLEQLKLTLVSPSGKTFSFLENIRIFISTDESDEIELASLDNITSSTGILELTPTIEKLDVYAKSSSYNLRTEVTTDETLTEDVDVQVDLKFRVTADTF
jgi:hypothetical protein